MARSKDDAASAGPGGTSPRAVRQRLESLAEAGVLDLPKRGKTRPSAGTAAAGEAAVKASAGEAAVKASASEAAVKASAAKAAVTASAAAGPRRGTGSSGKGAAGALEILRTEVEACRACGHLADARTHTVFGTGNPSARLCFLGEAPGADEDASGEPFVGRAGQLLTKIIEACSLTRDEVYILNVLKCRPPDNRRPEPAEVANCRGFFERQLEAISPEFICCLGASAAQALLRTEETIGKLRGRWFEHGKATVICTYHPSYLLRNPSAKRDVWDDMKRLMERMGIDIPAKNPAG